MFKNFIKPFEKPLPETLITATAERPTGVPRALGTPVGRSAVAVIRVSGSGFSKGFIKFLNIPVEKKGSWLRSLDLGGFSDQCLVLNFPGSNSYTGELTCV